MRLSATIDAAKQVENGLPDDYYQFLTTGGTGLKAGTPDTRIPECKQSPAWTIPADLGIFSL